ncbi:polysaccharide deacetylase [Arthrobacter gyeryongensis]|uniref:Polysaccharide deacetylase n=2 Tax=Arthrobacter gyeryongensis TaxID=1650592 RepID=A0ABP9SL97_9MICC
MNTPGRTDGTWLQGAAAAMMLSFDVDAESCVLAEGAHFSNHPGVMSHQAYGPQVGVPRILDMLKDLDVRATFFVPGRTAEQWPQVVESLLAHGHEVGHHSYAHRRLVEMSPEEEREDFERGLHALKQVGASPVGHRSPLSSPSIHTADILAANGFSYDSTLMDDDRPYLLTTPHGTLVELPLHWTLDDFPQYAYLPDPPIGNAIESPRKALEVWSLELQAMRRYGGLFVLCCHPFLSGRPSRVEALRELIVGAQETGDVAILTGAELAARVKVDSSVPVRPDFLSAPLNHNHKSKVGPHA